MKKIESGDLLAIAKTALGQMGVRAEVKEITYAMKEGEVWKVNFKYSESGQWYRESAFSVHCETGEILGLWKDRLWR